SRTPVWPATRRRRTNMRITRQVSKGVLLLGLLQAGIHAAQAAEACAGYDDLPTTLELDAGLQYTLQLPAAVERLAVGRPQVAEVQLLDGDAVLITAQDSGVTNISVWTDCAQQPWQTMLFV